MRARTRRFGIGLFSDSKRLVFLVYRFLEKTLTDIYLKRFDREDLPEPIFRGIDYSLALRLLDDQDVRHYGPRCAESPHRRNSSSRKWKAYMGRYRSRNGYSYRNWLVVGDRMFVSYTNQMKHTVSIFDFSGQKLGELPTSDDETVRMIGGSLEGDELLLETESFAEPIAIFRYSRKPIGRCCGRRKIFSLTQQTTEIPESGSRPRRHKSSHVPRGPP